VILVDANLLIYAADRTSPHHEPAAAWLENQLNGTIRVGVPWESLTAFCRIATHPRVMARPLSASGAWAVVRGWLEAPIVWTPTATERHGDVLGGLIERHRVTGNLVYDAHLAALAIQHGLEICSADADFARFTEVSWRNPLA
jgi:toxin-antitoxin system PIN domain toxin